MPLGGIGFWELMTVMVVVLLVMGPAKIPDVARTLGKGVRAARRATNELKRAMDMETYEAPIREWERDLSVSEADVYEEPEAQESVDDLHNPDGTLKDSTPSLPGTVSQADPIDEILNQSPDAQGEQSVEDAEPEVKESDAAGGPAYSSDES